MNLTEDVASMYHDEWCKLTKENVEDLEKLFFICTRDLESLSKEDLETLVEIDIKINNYRLQWKPYRDIEDSFKKDKEYFANRIINLIQKYNYTIRRK